MFTAGKISNWCKQNSLMLNESKYNAMFINFQKKVSKSLTLFALKTCTIGYWLCSILLSGLPAYKIKPLESILRSDVRVVYNIPHCEWIMT